MRKLYLIFILIIGFNFTYAQTEEQTLEWLLTKKAEVYDVSSITVQEGTRRIEITDDILHAYSDNGAFTKINWKGIKDVSKTDVKSQIVIISNTMYNGLNTCIFFKIDNPELLEKYIKALRHMAILKGAIMIDDNLF
ncbi:hypothetical protein [Empedobacter sedimenti]|uniref:hypothetical protein n=1 Tax=Empedobacter sedimenti TaxID=3042610 RepID=UPI0024A63B9E|nr:hypothetical protein [Empedobacter sedimenti]